MKTLLVLRHGKSSWSDTSLSDHDRPLKGRGKRASTKIGTALRDRRMVPDLVLSSTAKRSRATAKRVAKEAGCAVAPVQDSELYFSGVSRQIAAIARRAQGGEERVLIVGHNPTLEDLVSTLTGDEVTLTTANLAAISLDIDDWGDLPKARGKLLFVFRPRELGA